jgi:hypothetical protein
MAKNIEKKTGATSRADRADRVDSAIEAVQLERREQALKRVLEWAWLERALDHALDHAEEGSDSLAYWQDPERRVAFNDRVPTNFGGEELPNVTNRRLCSVLKIATSRCFLLDANSAPFVNLSTWFDPKEAEGKWASFERSYGAMDTIAKFSQDLAAAIKLVRLLLEEDLALAAVTTHRKPSPLEAGILDVLLEADRSLSAEEIASKVQRKLGGSKPPKAILAAIGKLRADCGFSELFAGHAGFKLKANERALAAKLLGR